MEIFFSLLGLWCANLSSSMIYDDCDDYFISTSWLVSHSSWHHPPQNWSPRSSSTTHTEVELYWCGRWSSSSCSWRTGSWLEVFNSPCTRLSLSIAVSIPTTYVVRGIEASILDSGRARYLWVIESYHNSGGCSVPPWSCHVGTPRTSMHQRYQDRRKIAAPPQEIDTRCRAPWSSTTFLLWDVESCTHLMIPTQRIHSQSHHFFASLRFVSSSTSTDCYPPNIIDFVVGSTMSRSLWCCCSVATLPARNPHSIWWDNSNNVYWIRCLSPWVCSSECVITLLSWISGDPTWLSHSSNPWWWSDVSGRTVWPRTTPPTYWLSSSLREWSHPNWLSRCSDPSTTRGTWHPPSSSAKAPVLILYLYKWWFYLWLMMLSMCVAFLLAS